MFSKKEFDQVSLNEIISKSNSGKSSFYRLYENKLSIYFTCLELIKPLKIEFLKSMDSKDGGLFSILRNSKEFLDYLYNVDEKLYNLSINSLKESNREVNNLYKAKKKDETIKYLHGLFKTYSEQNVIRTDIPIDYICEYFYFQLIDPNQPWNKKESNENEMNYSIKLLKSAIGYNKGD